MKPRRWWLTPEHKAKVRDRLLAELLRAAEADARFAARSWIGQKRLDFIMEIQQSAALESCVATRFDGYSKTQARIVVEIHREVRVAEAIGRFVDSIVEPRETSSEARP